jgi:hypothetical protein
MKLSMTGQENITPKTIQLVYAASVLSSQHNDLTILLLLQQFIVVLI